VSHQIGSLMDLYTTMIKLAGQEPPTDRVVDGIDLTGVLLNSTTIPRYYIYNKMLLNNTCTWFG